MLMQVSRPFRNTGNQSNKALIRLIVSVINVITA